MADRSARDAAESPIVKDDDSEFADSLSLPSRVLELVGLAKEIASHDCSRLHEFIALICDLWDIRYVIATQLSCSLALDFFVDGGCGLP
jgi:hypothetical protein